VIQSKALHHLKEGSVVKVTGVGRDKFIHAMFLSSICVKLGDGGIQLRHVPSLSVELLDLGRGHGLV